MRISLCVVVLCASVYCWFMFSQKLALRIWGLPAKATISTVSAQSDGRGMPSEAFYSFTTVDKTRAEGFCSVNKGTKGGWLNVLYLRARPSINEPASLGYCMIGLLLYGGIAFALTLWGSRVALYRKKSEPRGHDVAPDGHAERPLRNYWLTTLAVALLFGTSMVGGGLAVHADFSSGLWQQLGGADLALAADAELTRTNDIPGLRRATAPGNSANGSLVAFDDEWLYFHQWRDQSAGATTSPGIYRCHKNDGSDRVKVGSDSQAKAIDTGIDVWEGFLYFRTAEGYSRMTVGGSRERQLLENAIRSACIVDGVIYYQPEWDHGRFWRMSLTGGSQKRLCNDDVGAGCVASDGFIYYSNKADGGHIYRISVEGKARAKVVECPARVIVVEKGELWFIDADTEQLKRCYTDGSELKTIVQEKVSSFNLTPDGLLFSQQGVLSRATRDGAETQKIATKHPVWEVFINGERIYYRLGMGNGPIWSMKQDGSDAKRLWPVPSK